MKATHLFVTNTPAELVEGSVNLTVPWRWVRSVGEIVLLRWFPKTPIPLHF
jgi:sporulation protein YlmC with PRC-barrel domain